MRAVQAAQLHDLEGRHVVHELHAHCAQVRPRAADEAVLDHPLPERLVDHRRQVEHAGQPRQPLDVLGLGRRHDAVDHRRRKRPLGLDPRREPFVDHAGERYTLESASLNPKPHATLPILVGGSGEKVMPKIVARYADEWNHWSLPEHFAAKKAIFDAAIERAGRSENSLWRSTQAVVFFDDADKAAALAAKGRPAIGGSSQQIADHMHAYAAAGVDEFILPVTTLTDPAAIADTGDRPTSTSAPGLWHGWHASPRCRSSSRVRGSIAARAPRNPPAWIRVRRRARRPRAPRTR